MTLRLCLLFVVLFGSCKSESTTDLLVNSHCGNKYSIDYNADFGLFIIQRSNRSDTISLSENWDFALYRLKQCKGEISSEMSYDAFRQSSYYFLPTGQKEFDALNENPRLVFESQAAPRLCDCIDELGNYDAANPACEKKFQVYRSSFNDSLSWLFSFYRDKCRGQIAENQNFNEWKDTITAQSERAEQIARRIQFVQDSIENTAPARQCSGSDYLPPYQRTSSFSSYKQCRASTRHSSGRCGKHR